MSKELIKRALPSINDLYSNAPVIDKQNRLNILLSQNPKPDWVKKHPFAKNVNYLPISIVEWLLTSIFVKWRVEVKEVKVMANSALVVVRLHYQDPISMEWEYQDGIGAAPIQTVKGAKAMDTDNVTTDAVMKAAPAAESYAIKDAAEKLGRLFGKDLNRNEFLPYTNLEGKIDLDEVECQSEQISELYDLLKQATLTHDEVDDYRDKLSGRVSVSAYQLYKRELLDLIVHPIDKVRNGQTVSMAEINEAVNAHL